MKTKSYLPIWIGCGIVALSIGATATLNYCQDLQMQIDDLQVKCDWQEEAIVDRNDEIELLESVINQKFSAAVLPEGPGDIYLDIDLSKELQLYNWQVCKYFGIDYKLFISLMYTESRFDNNAGKNTKYVGLVQMSRDNVETIETELNVEINLLDPYDNILAGAYWLSRYAAKYPDDLTMQLKCYNMGEVAAKNVKGSTIYTNNILSYYLNI